MQDNFDIPIALIIFRRKDTVLRIIDVLRLIKPRKIYLLSDQGRNDIEKVAVSETRQLIIDAINWDCEIIKRFADENIGVYANIALGAKYVFEHEERAIFLEDDNLPEVTFFQYCADMLDYYEQNEKVLWVCGTSYIRDKRSFDTNVTSYVFTQHLLPCGWASWRDKFISSYDWDLKLLQNIDSKQKFSESYGANRALFHQQLTLIEQETQRKQDYGRYMSWDYHMLLSLRASGKFGIAPINNQIRNIGADDFSTHGGTSMELEMTQRFCEIPTRPITWPLVHPDNVEVNDSFERLTSDLILWPRKERLKYYSSVYAKKILRIPVDDSIKQHVKRIFIK